MFFDGTVNKKGYGIGILLIAPDDSHTSISIKLIIPYTNNMTEYEGCTVGVKVTLKKRIHYSDGCWDYALIFGQVLRRWKVKGEKMLPFPAHLEELASQF